MAKKKPTTFSVGYSDWSVLRLMREAQNVARWNPWKAHEWMDEARNQMTLDSLWYDEYDRTVDAINSLWREYQRHRWFSPRQFWSRGGIAHPPKWLEPLASSDSDISLDTIFSTTLKI